MFRFIPFSRGPRKCVDDQFALLEAIVALAIFLQRLNFELVPDQNISMTTGATIHTTNVISPHRLPVLVKHKNSSGRLLTRCFLLQGLYMKLSERRPDFDFSTPTSK